MKTNTAGFSLVELLIVVAVLGILAAMAINMSSGNSEKARLASLKSVMLEIQSKQERYSVNNRKYGTLANLGYADPLYIDEEGNAVAQSKSFYKLSITKADDFSFKISAEPQRSQVSNPCGTLTLDQDGKKTAASTTVHCW